MDIHADVRFDWKIQKGQSNFCAQHNAWPATDFRVPWPFGTFVFCALEIFIFRSKSQIFPWLVFMYLWLQMMDVSTIFFSVCCTSTEVGDCDAPVIADLHFQITASWPKCWWDRIADSWQALVFFLRLLNRWFQHCFISPSPAEIRHALDYWVGMFLQSFLACTEPRIVGAIHQ